MHHLQRHMSVSQNNKSSYEQVMAAYQGCVSCTPLTAVQATSMSFLDQSFCDMCRQLLPLLACIPFLGPAVYLALRPKTQS